MAKRKGANSMNCAINTNPRRTPLMLLKRATVRNVSRALKEINAFEDDGLCVRKPKWLQTYRRCNSRF